MCLQGLTGAIIKSKLFSSDVCLAALLQTCSQFVQDIAVSQLLIHRIMGQELLLSLSFSDRLSYLYRGFPNSVWYNYKLGFSSGAMCLFMQFSSALGIVVFEKILLCQ